MADDSLDMPKPDHPASLRSPDPAATTVKGAAHRTVPRTWQDALRIADLVHLRGHYQATLVSSAEIQALANTLLQAEPLLDAAAMWSLAPDSATREEALTDFEIVARRLFGRGSCEFSAGRSPSAPAGRTSSPTSKTPPQAHGSDEHE